MAVIDDIVKLGQEQGSSPQEIADAIDLFHAETSGAIEQSGSGAEDTFKALSKLDDDRNTKIVELRNKAMAAEMVKQFPDPIDLQAFLHTQSNLKNPDNEGSVVIPPEYEDKAKAINAAGEPFQERMRSYGQIQFGDNVLGSFVERPAGGNSFQFLIQDNPAPSETPDRPFAKPVEGKAPTMLTRSVKVDREALIKEAEAEYNALNEQFTTAKENAQRALVATTGGTRLVPDDTGKLRPVLPEVRPDQIGDAGLATALANAKARLEVARNRPLNEVARMELIRGLKDDKEFKDKIPNDWAEQFLVRPILSTIQGFGRTGAAVVGDKSVLEAPSPIDAIAPGALRNRFEYQGQGEPTADLLAQGVESLLTYLAPGGVAKGAGALLKSTQAGAAIAAEQAALGTTAKGVASSAGSAGFGATAYGNSLSERLQLANNTADPVEAQRIRNWAPFLAFADAAKEVLTEKLIPGDVESLINKGLTGSFGKRLLNAGLIAPAKEGLEEVAGVGLEQLYQGTPGTPESQSLLQAFRGGFVGGLAFSPAALFSPTKGVQTDGRVYTVNGKQFDTQQAAEAAAEELKAKAINEVLAPMGIKTREDASQFLLDHAKAVSENPDSVTQDDYDAAAFVTEVAPSLPAAPAVQQNAPSSVGQTEEAGAVTGGIATPVEGIAPDSGLANTPAPLQNVNQENLPAEGGLKVLQKFDLEESERLISTTRAGDKRSKNEGRVRPEGLKSPVSLVELPVSGFTPETLDFVRTSTDQGRITRYKQEGVETPIYVGVKKDGSFFIKDGGHRLMAKINKGADTVQAYITQDDLGKLEQQRATPQTVNPPIPVEAPPSAAGRVEEISRFAPNIKYFAQDNSTPEGQVLEKFAQTTGTRIVRFTSDPRGDGKITNGFVVPGDNKTIYIRQGSAQPMLHVLMHEFYHSREDMPEYKQFAEELKAIEPEAWSRASQLFPNDEAKALSEFAADVFGSRGTEKEFWDRLANVREKMEPGLFRKFAQYLSQVWESIKQKIGYERYVQVKNAAEIDRRIANLLRLAAPETSTEQAAAATIKEGAANVRFTPELRQQAIDRFKGISQSEIKVEPRGRQSGFGITQDLDLYNIVQPGSKVDGTTFGVPAGTDVAGVQQRAREKFAEAGEAVPGEIRQSEITPQQDADYMAAVERGDMETAQKMVDAAARAAGYRFKLHRGDEKSFTEFNSDFKNKNFTSAIGFSLTDDKETAAVYGEPREFFVKGKTWTVDYLKDQYGETPETAQDWQKAYDEENLAGLIGADEIDDTEDSSQIEEYWDGLPGKPSIIRVKNIADNDLVGGGDRLSTLFIVKNPNQIKSADPVTRDDQGNVIPLSQRFNPESNDIRQSETAQQPFNPQKNNDVLTVGGFHLENGAVDYPTWSQKVLADLGPQAGEYLRGAYESLRYSGLPNVNQMTSAFDIDNPGPQVRQAPELTPQEEKAIEDGGTGIKNAATDELRKRFGVEAAKELETQSNSETLAIAAQKLKENPNIVDSIIGEYLNTEDPRPLTAWEEALLMGQNLQAQARYEAATVALTNAEDAGDLVKKGEALAALGTAREEIHALLDIERKAGTAWGRAGQFRQRMLNRDYSLVRMQYNYRSAANQGGQLTPQQEAEVANAKQKIDDAQAAVAAATEADLDARVQNYLDLFFKQRAATVASITTPFKLKAAAAGAKERLKALAKPIVASEVQQSAALSPEVLNDLSIVGAEYIQDGASSLEDFQKRLQADFGDQFNDSVQFIYEAAQEFQRSLNEKVTGKKAAAKKGAVKATVDIAANGKDAPDRQTVKELVRLEVESGKRGTKEVFDTVFAILSPVFPNMTMRGLKEIFSNYGNAVFPSKDEVKVQLRELHRLAQLEVTLERLQTGMDTLKSGPQRDKVSAEVRAMQRQIADLKKKLGVDQKSEEQLAGALTAAKNRIRNQIEDLNRFIAAGGRTPEERATRPAARVDDELKALRKERDDLQKTLTQLEGRKPLSMEKRIELTIAALERSEEELTRRLESETFKRAAKTTDTVTSDEIEERRSYNATLRQALKEGRDALRERKTPAQKALDAAAAALDRYEGILSGRIVPEPRAPRQALSQEEEDLRLQVEAMKQVLADERRAAAAAARPSEAQRRVDAAQKQLDKAQSDLDAYNRTGTLPKPTRFSAFSKVESELKDKAAALRDELRQKQQAAEAPQKQEDAARAERDRLQRVLAGTEAPRTAAPSREALTQAAEDLRLEIEAMRQVLRDEAAAKRRKPAEQKQLEAAKKALAKLEDILTGAVTPAARKETTILSEEEADIKAQILTARQEIAAARAADPSWLLNRDKKAILTRTAALKARLDNGDFAPKPKRVKVTDAELKKLQAEYRVVQNEWQRKLFEAGLASRTLPKKVVDFIRQGILSSRLFQLGGDFGVLLRQAGRVVGRPKTILNAVNIGRKSLFEADAAATEASLVADPYFSVALEAGVEITNWDDPTKITKQEELFASRWLNKPVIKSTDSPGAVALKKALDIPAAPVRGLGRAQVVALNYIRLEMFKAMCASMASFGAPTLNEMKHYATMVNVSTGRASMSAFEQAASGWLSTVFLAYRWAKSGLQYTVLHPLWMPIYEGKATLRSTAVVAAEYARNLSGIGMMYALYILGRLLNGGDDDKWKIEWDPRSSRFAKLPFGDSLVDPTAGISQWAVFLTKMVTKQKKTQSGKIVPLGYDEETGTKPAPGEGLDTELGRFLRNKLNPIVGSVYSLTFGDNKNPVGDPTTIGQEITRLVQPLIFRDVYESMKSGGVEQGLALGLLAFFGMGVNNYEDKRREKISTSDRAWLYDNQVSFGSLSDDATRGAMLGLTKEKSEKRGFTRRLTEDERKATLEKSLPAVQEAVNAARESYKSLPTEERQREKRIEQIQDRLNERVRKARERAYRALYPRG